MRKKTIGVVSVTLVILLIVFIVLYFLVLSKPKFEGGRYVDNASDFSEPIEYNQENKVLDSYFNNVSYTVDSVDFENEVVVLTITVPNYKKIIKDTIDTCLTENQNADFDTLYNIVESKLIENLSNKSENMLVNTITLPIEKIDSTWKIVPNDDFIVSVIYPIYESFSGGDIND